MQSAMKHKALAILMVSVALMSCGGGESTPPPTGPVITAFSADAASYWLGEQARLTVAFANGTGTLQPEGIPVTSGQTITTEMLSTPITYRLVVTDGATTVSRPLNLDVRYRDRLRAVAMPFSRGEHRAVHLPDDRVLIIGGENETNAFPATVYAFNPATETFAPFAELSSGRTGHIVQSLNNGDVLVSGGTRATLMASEAEVINHVTGAVTPTQNLPVLRRVNAASTLLMDGKVFICGGHIGAGVTDSVEVYDPATSTFTVLPAPLKVARLQHTVVRIDQRRLLVYGGFTEDSDPAPPEIYDVVAGESTVLTAPEAGVRGNHRAITLQDGGILIVGGEDYDQMPLRTVLRFDPGSTTFAPYATLATPRSAAAINRLVDGRLLVAGGVTDVLSSAATHTTELLSDTAQRRDGPDMGVRRRDHTVTRLNSGKLLIVGGLGTDLWPLASAEIYE
jgi:hypothetical protein